MVRGPVELRFPDASQTLRIVIPRSFAVGTREVTTGQYREFLRDSGGATVGPSRDDRPIDSVSWFDAARYCRWLSEREGIAEDQMCYPPLSQIRPGMLLVSGHLERSGYRLPTEAEWLHACQAGAETARLYGNDDRLMDHYGWTVFNANGHSWPVGRLAPNALGLFDIIGNVYEWCEGTVATYASARPAVPLEDPDGSGNVSAVENRILRGGSFDSRISNLSAAFRNFNPPVLHSRSVGFRVARTCK
jgi:formylglycine-generating enzyme required for sulfatase activity